MCVVKPTIYLYTDGAASPNPGLGGYGVVLKCGDHMKEMSAGYVFTTNNRMELLAVIVGLEAVKWDKAEVQIFSDSQYVVNALNNHWLDNWERKGWRRVKNVDLWQRFLAVYKRHKVTFNWIKGHAGHPENERCDALAVSARSGSAGELLRDEVYEEEEAKKKTESLF